MRVWEDRDEGVPILMRNGEFQADFGVAKGLVIAERFCFLTQRNEKESKRR